MKKSSAKIFITKNGPYKINDWLPLDKQIIIADEDGMPVGWQKGQEYQVEETYKLCRCGKSKNKPFCDGSHEKGFNGTETASSEKYLNQAKITEGPELDLSDAPSLCASASFCDRAGGTWELIQNSDNPESKKLAVQQCCDCPSGRLVAWDKRTGKAIEPKFEMEISLVEDPPSGVSGPIWVKGGVDVESENGHKYETRNRVTLCRCGKSKNKPYCDGSHIECSFNDGDESINFK